jgi:chromosome segregation ATPase
MSEQPKEELKIKDLLIKLQVLSNGLVEERKKSQSYLNRIKEYEESVQKKDAEIADLTKEKFELKTKLTIERSKQVPAKKNDSYFSSFLNKIIDKPVDESKVAKLEEKINEQSNEIKDLTQKLMEQKEDYDQQAIKYQTKITLQTQEIGKLKQNLENAIKNIPKRDSVSSQQSQQDKIDLLNRKFNIERDEYEKKLSILKDEIRVLTEKNESLEANLNKYKAEYETKTIENNAMKKQITDLDSKLNIAKIEIHDKQLSPRMFQVERMKDGLMTKQKKVMTVIFQWTKSKNACEVIFKRMKHGGKAKEDVVNIMDISLFKINDKKKDNIDVIYTVSFYI